MGLIQGFSDGLSAGVKVRAAKDAKAAKTPKAEPGGADAGSAPAAAELTPLERAGNWVKDKLSSLTPASAPAAPPSEPGGSGDVGLIERLKAGNIDDPKSEAYRRWGKGKGAMAAPVASAANVVDPEANRLYTSEEWAGTPEPGTGANPAWQEFDNTRGGI